MRWGAITKRKVQPMTRIRLAPQQRGQRRGPLTGTDRCNPPVAGSAGGLWVRRLRSAFGRAVALQSVGPTRYSMVAPVAELWRRRSAISLRRHCLYTPFSAAMCGRRIEARAPAGSGFRGFVPHTLDQLRFRPALACGRTVAIRLSGTALADDIADRGRRAIIRPRDAGKRLPRLVSGHD